MERVKKLLPPLQKIGNARDEIATFRLIDFHNLGANGCFDCEGAAAFRAVSILQATVGDLGSDHLPI
jgi:hypothetical protein